MSTPLDDTGLAAKASELERLLPDDKQSDFRQLVTELLETRELLLQKRSDLTTQQLQRSEETTWFRERLRRQACQLERLQEIFLANDHVFLTFRSALTLSRKLRHLTDLPDMLARLRQAVGVRAISCLLAKEDFEAYVPAGFPCPSLKALSTALKLLPAQDPDRRVYLGEVSVLPRPEFFFGPAILAEHPDLLTGSCFIAQLSDKYRPKRRIGVLAMAAPDPCRFTADKGTDFLEHFCEVLSGDLLHVKIHEELTRKRESDELTGIPNRAYLRRHGPPMLTLAERRGSPVSLLFCDLNRFKAVNDTFGHEMGDAVLCDVARAMAARVRAYDLLARLGGDEFVILMPDATLEEASVMAERMRSCVDEVAHGRGLADTAGLSVSIGMALHVPGQDIDDLVRQADEAMYVDKRGDD